MVCRQKPNVLDRAVAFQLAENGWRLSTGAYQNRSLQIKIFSITERKILEVNAALKLRMCYAHSIFHNYGFIELVDSSIFVWTFNFNSHFNFILLRIFRYTLQYS